MMPFLRFLNETDTIFVEIIPKTKLTTTEIELSDTTFKVHFVL
jgi:hypothetical protein